MSKRKLQRHEYCKYVHVGLLSNKIESKAAKYAAREKKFGMAGGERATVANADDEKLTANIGCRPP